MSREGRLKMAEKWGIRQRYNTAAVFAAALFVLAQCLTLIHTQQFGDEPHEHNGVQCLFVGGVFDDDVAAAPAAFIAVAIAFVFAQVLAPASSPSRTPYNARHGPRAPPLR